MIDKSQEIEEGWLDARVDIGKMEAYIKDTSHFWAGLYIKHGHSGIVDEKGNLKSDRDWFL